tara:strand:- start:1744 stop:2127 length:384 start_codon:yes stop_codon:yes gene_type:complete
MKSLNEYTDKPTTELLESTGSFFAFGKKQYEECVVEGVTYCFMGNGLYCPEEHADTIWDKYFDIVAFGRMQRLNEVGKTAIIEYELNNFEAYYTGDTSDAFECCKPYGITESEVIAVYNRVAPTVDW